MPTSKKRGISELSPTKYYAVKAGHTPGVYTIWADCQENITGFKGAQYKSFPTDKEARDFVAGKVNRSASKSTEDKFYGVAVGHHPGVYEEWEDAQEQIKGVKGPKYKKFATRAEAEEFVRSGGKSSAIKGKEAAVGEPKSKRARTSTESAATTSASKVSKSKTNKVYTDGSALGNGRHGASAGLGVYFGAGDPRNVSAPLPTDPQTNQRAELAAVLSALEIVPKDKDILIATDSNYTINCCDVWYKGWKKNGWKTSNGGPVLNQDLVVAIRVLIDERNENGAATNFEWVKGHSGDPGNEAADRLAVAGALAGRARLINGETT